MAEGWARASRGESVEACSAGTSAQGMNRLAVRAMAEVGIDISGQRSKHVRDVGDVRLDVVVTVCGSAREACPVMVGARQVHVGFDDPPALARQAQSDDEAMAHYRRVRDEIRVYIETLPGALRVQAKMNETLKGMMHES